MLSKFHAYFNLQADSCKLVEIKGHVCYGCSVTFVSTISLKETCMSLVLLFTKPLILTTLH